LFTNVIILKNIVVRQGEHTD